MSHDEYRYEFDVKVPLTEVRDSLFLAALCAEGVHGRAQMRMDADFRLDGGKRTCVVNADTPVGQSIARIFTGLLVRQFGDDAFTVDRVGAANDCRERAAPPAPAEGQSP